MMMPEKGSSVAKVAIVKIQVSDESVQCPVTPRRKHDRRKLTRAIESVSSEFEVSFVNQSANEKLEE